MLIYNKILLFFFPNSDKYNIYLILKKSKIKYAYDHFNLGEASDKMIVNGNSANYIFFLEVNLYNIARV